MSTEIKVKDIGQLAIKNMTAQVNSFAELEGTPLSPNEMSNATNMVVSIMKLVGEKEITDPKTKMTRLSTISDYDVALCQLPQQIKRLSRLGLSFAEKELYVDTRYNKNSGKYDINIKKQYQGIEKEILKFCSKKVVRFYTDVICTGDKFETKTDFMTGLTTVLGHEKNKDCTMDRNKLENITGAFKIAYVEERGELVQYVAIIDKNRIMRAYNSAMTKKIWDADTVRMVLKTASWVLYQNVLKPFMSIPEDLKMDWQESNNTDDFDFELKQEVVDSVADAETSTGDFIDVDFDEVCNESEV